MTKSDKVLVILFRYFRASVACSPYSPWLCQCRGWPLRIAGWAWARCHPGPIAEYQPAPFRPLTPWSVHFAWRGV